MKILNIVGARPNFMKVAPLHAAFGCHPDIDSKIVHTGQHFDAKMSDVFFRELGLPAPDYFLNVGGGSHTEQTARIMIEFEKVLKAEKPDAVLVVGDVNSTIACSLVAVKEHVPVIHVEAGLRSGDRRMPEEINRILTDNISDLLFVTEPAGLENLKREGIPDSKVHLVGNVMIDSLVKYREKAATLDLLSEHRLEKEGYVLMTFHRPSNVDHPEGLRSILQILRQTAERKTVVFPVHPRTLKNFSLFSLEDDLKAIDNLVLMEPQGYLTFLHLMENAALVVTDSGGIQEETTYLQVPCLTFRASTERPITVEVGTNYLLADLDPASAARQIDEILSGNLKKGGIPPLWDGFAAERIAGLIAEKLPSLTYIKSVEPCVIT